ncbi:unnamed protein product [Soboliphyme baturini]|uniref:C2H2-type domain-containing protein n=1 Tax=Soboliphyme baturini TaxID=241478 RepID=A0A183I8S3_9BILA|nr:unnamed protein product [Soboliphyme baturini]
MRQEALKSVGGENVAAALEWLLREQEGVEEHQEKISGDIPGKSTDMAKNAEASDPSAVSETSKAQSIKCDECGKLLATEADVLLHSTKSGHSTFSESTEQIQQMTEEERKERLKAIESKIKENRIKMEALDRQKAIDMEKQRRKTGQELLQAKQKYDDTLKVGFRSVSSIQLYCVVNFAKHWRGDALLGSIFWLEEMEMKKLIEERKKNKREDYLAKYVTFHRLDCKLCLICLDKEFSSRLGKIEKLGSM